MSFLSMPGKAHRGEFLGTEYAISPSIFGFVE